MVSNLTYLQLSLRCTTFFLFRFRSNHPFGGVPLRCKTPTQLQSRQMAQQVPNHSGDAGTQLHPLTSFSLHPSLALSLSNWVISPALYPPLYFLLSPPSSFQVFFFFLTPPLSPSAMDSPQPGQSQYHQHDLLYRAKRKRKKQLTRRQKKDVTLFLSPYLESILDRSAPHWFPVLASVLSVPCVTYHAVLKLPNSAQPRTKAVHVVIKFDIFHRPQPTVWYSKDSKTHGRPLANITSLLSFYGFHELITQ